LYLVALLTLAVRQSIHEVRRENELDALALDSKLGLPVAQEVTKINVEQLQHNTAPISTKCADTGIESQPNMGTAKVIGGNARRTRRAGR
jgi:hypothetical protein